MITDAKKILEENGQALMEFVLFLPFMLMMYFTILSISNAINGSINQQKVTRGYFYYRAANNSMIPRPRRDGAEPSDSWRTFGMQIMGWAHRFEGGQTPVATCYKFKLPFGEAEDDSCDKAYTEKTTQFIRVQTVYGLCGATFSKQGTNQNMRHPSGANAFMVSEAGSCQILE